MSSKPSFPYPPYQGYQQPTSGSAWTSDDPSVQAPYSGDQHHPYNQTTYSQPFNPPHGHDTDPNPTAPNNDAGGWAYAAAPDDLLWPHHKFYLNVCFLNGSASDRVTVRSLVEEHYNTIPMSIKFNFLEDGEALYSDIRIFFTISSVSKSYIGRDAEDHPGQQTMTLNMHWNDRASNGERHRRMQSDVLHEFGHALGMKHEQNHPDCPARWNYQNIARRKSWNPQQVHHNYRKLESARTTTSEYDPKSIMHYPVEEGDTHGRTMVVPRNTVLSDGDREFLMLMYPMPESPIPSPRPKSSSGSTSRSVRSRTGQTSDRHGGRRGHRGDQQRQQEMYQQETLYATESTDVYPRVFDAGHDQSFEDEFDGYEEDPDDDESVAVEYDQDTVAAEYSYPWYDSEAGASEWQRYLQ